MIDTLLDTQPKESSGGSGKSPEEEVKEKAQKELLPDVPKDFVMMDVVERLRNLKGPPRLYSAGKYLVDKGDIFLK